MCVHVVLKVFFQTYLQVIYVFCMVTYQKLTYSVEDSTPLSMLREWIELDTRVPSRELELLLASGQQIDANGLVSQCFSSSSQVRNVLDVINLNFAGFIILYLRSLLFQ